MSGMFPKNNTFQSQMVAVFGYTYFAQNDDVSDRNNITLYHLRIGDF
jgi:hypothetical protein